MACARTVADMYITQRHNRWPRTPARLAARLRQVVALPGLTVRTQRNRLSISWVSGPPAPAVFREFDERLSNVVSYRIVRLYPVAVFGAALLTAYTTHGDHERAWRATWRTLHERDLSRDEFDEGLLAQGAVLAATAGVPVDAVVGWGRRRWDVDMCLQLKRLGPGVLAAICAVPRR